MYFVLKNCDLWSYIKKCCHIFKGHHVTGILLNRPQTCLCVPAMWPKFMLKSKWASKCVQQWDEGGGEYEQWVTADGSSLCLSASPSALSICPPPRESLGPPGRDGLLVGLVPLAHRASPHGQHGNHRQEHAEVRQRRAHGDGRRWVRRCGTSNPLWIKMLKTDENRSSLIRRWTQIRPPP